MPKEIEGCGTLSVASIVFVKKINGSAWINASE
jgi:hypothetical protein